MDNQNQPTQDGVSAPESQSTSEAQPTQQAATPPSEPANSHGRNWKKWIIIGFVLVMLIISGGALVLSQQKTNTPEIKTLAQPTIGHPSPTPNPTTILKTYTDTQYNFYFQYPSSLETCITCSMAGPLSTNLNSLVVFKDPKTGPTHFDGFAVFVIPNTNNISFKDYIDQEQNITFKSSGKRLPEAQISIDGIEGVDIEGPAFGINSISVPFPDNKNFLVISYGSSKEIKKTLVDILKTFKFKTKPTQMCTPRPACLDADPPCLMPEPANVCPKTPTACPAAPVCKEGEQLIHGDPRDNTQCPTYACFNGEGTKFN